MYTLCVDLGATFIKFGVFDSSGKLLKVSRTPCPPFLDESGPNREVSFEKIYEIVLGQLQNHFATLTDLNISKMAFSTQMQGFVLVNKETNKISSNYFSWQDKRSLNCREIFEAALNDQIRYDIGNEFKLGHAVTTLLALNQQSKIAPNLIPLPLGDAIISQLIGEIPKMHATNACGYGAWSVQKKEWHFNFLNSLGLSEIKFPSVTNHFCKVGNYRGASVFTCVGDQQAALLGAGLNDDENLISVNVATGSQVGLISKAYYSSVEESKTIQIRPYFEDAYLHCVTHLPAGRSINFILKSFYKGTSTQIDNLFAEIPIPDHFSTDLKVNLNFFPTSIGYGGSIENITEENLTLPAILYASYLKMAENYFAICQNIDPNLSRSTILGSGGILIKSKVLQRLLTEKTGRKLKISDVQEDALFGLFKLCKQVQT